MGIVRRTYTTVRNFLFSWPNKDFLIFLFFLMFSGIFWLQMTLNETYEKEFLIPVKITGVPKNIVFTTDDNDTVKVTLRDKGLQLISYMYGERLHALAFNFKTYARNGGRGSIPSLDIQKAVYQQLSTSTKIIAVKPDKVEFFYNYGQHKRVPVKLAGNVVPESLYFISGYTCQPESVDVYAIQGQLDSIHMVYTEPLNYTNFRDTLTVKSRLSAIHGAKIVPRSVTLRFYTDVLTEESIDDVPIQGINMPEGRVLRTFPSKVTVSFVTGVSIFRRIGPEDFKVVVDYEEIKRKPSDKCTLHLRHVPHGVTRAKLSIQEVDYLIEEE